MGFLCDELHIKCYLLRFHNHSQKGKYFDQVSTRTKLCCNSPDISFVGLVVARVINVDKISDLLFCDICLCFSN